VIAVAVIGVLGGVVAGLLGVGGGVLFVPALALLVGLTQQQAEATSLLAIAPVALAGALIGDRHGSVRRRDACWIGVAAVPGTAGGVALANALSGAVLRDAFAAFLILIAARMVLAVRADGDERAAGVDPTAPRVP
jgi:uncharacterized membrane protein YfcA